MSAKTIEVRITPESLIGCKSEHIAEATVVSTLRAAGIPVVGVFVYRGVSRGTMARRYEKHTGTHVFVWRDSLPKNQDLFKDQQAA